MTTIYHYTGIITFWAIVACGTIYAAILLLNFIGFLIDKFCKPAGAIWRLLEWVYYRDRFKKWVKDKYRITDLQSFNNRPIDN